MWQADCRQNNAFVPRSRYDRWPVTEHRPCWRVPPQEGKCKKNAARKAEQNGSRSRRSDPPRQSTPSAERYSEIQQVLAEKGFYTGPVTGVWGTESVEALRKFQSDQKLAPDGKLGARSLIALVWDHSVSR
ncbi:MAG: peptidoglycan-binding domain-containing protein [Bryobacteraceae bacterium]